MPAQIYDDWAAVYVDSARNWTPMFGASDLARLLPAVLAHDLMHMNEDACGPTQRLEFKGGTWPAHETSQGGMNEDALTRFFGGRLSEYLARPNVGIERLGTGPLE